LWDDSKPRRRPNPRGDPAIVIALATGLVIQRTSNPPVDSANTVPASLDIALAGWEEEVLEHRAALLASLDRQRDRLPAESIAAVEENLGLIDEAIREIRDALEQNPDNRQLNFLLANAYQQEVQLLKRLNDV
jgi:tetratricopeptide (TPR) repeat protein